MSPVGIGLDVLLIALLLVALRVGLTLNKKLNVLREGQLGFVKAVNELDTAAARAEAALKALRAASEDAHDQLLNRIETARALSAKLESVTLEAERVRAVAATATPVPAALARAESRLAARFQEDRAAVHRPTMPRGPDEDLFETEPKAAAYRRTAGDRR